MKAKHRSRGDSRNDSKRTEPTRKRREGNARFIISFVCVALMIVCAAYMIMWEARKIRIERENAAYRALYAQSDADPVPTDANAAATVPPADAQAEAHVGLPAQAPSGKPSTAPADAQTEASVNSTAGLPTQAPAGKPSTAPADAQTEAPVNPTAGLPAQATVPAGGQTPIPASATAYAGSEMPTDAASSPTGDAIAVDATRAPRATADADTLVFALETPPPVQSSFNALLALNPETVGYLRAGEDISLPVVQRKNDNEYYLNHSFEGEESIAGTLFLDGANLLIPEDDNLIIYGHNMRNGSMFHALSLYEEADYIRKHPIVHFDTIYENRLYVPFAAFTASMETDSERYLDIRRFLFDEGSFDAFVQKIRQLSTVETDVDVRYGDRLLMLVTCEYLHDNGRFVVALRELRLDETEAQLRSVLASARDR